MTVAVAGNTSPAMHEWPTGPQGTVLTIAPESAVWKSAGAEVEQCVWSEVRVGCQKCVKKKSLAPYPQKKTFPDRIVVDNYNQL